MKRILAVIVAVCLALFAVTSVSAADGNVTYDGKAQEFIFEPRSDYTPTDLFPNFKDVMPGDKLTQSITVKNERSNEVKVNIYIRSLGALEGSEAFLSQLNMKVVRSENNTMAYMFDAAADQTAGMTDWVYLGTLYSGGEVNLDVVLGIPVELDNNYQNQIGYLDWEFMIEEFPVDPDDPKPPQTSDNSNLGLWLAVMICSLTMMIILLVWSKKDKEKEENAVKR